MIDPPAFPPVLADLRSIMTQQMKVDLDLWVFEGFNAVYKPSGWTRNPVSDETLFCFAKDGVGGQVISWQRQKEDDPLISPVVFLGRDGEIAVIATDLAGFGRLFSAGISPYQIAADEIPEEPEENPTISKWYQKWFSKSEPHAVPEILKAAKTLHTEFEALVKSHRQPR